VALTGLSTRRPHRRAGVALLVLYAGHLAYQLAGK